jgi:hypothetical protein
LTGESGVPASVPQHDDATPDKSESEGLLQGREEGHSITVGSLHRYTLPHRQLHGPEQQLLTYWSFHIFQFQIVYKILAFYF